MASPRRNDRASSPFRATTARIRRFAASGGISPRWWRTRRAGSSACNSRCFAKASNPAGANRSTHGAAAKSSWATRPFPTSTGRRHWEDERLARGHPALAGAQASPFRVHIEGWELASVDARFWPLRLDLKTRHFAVELTLTRYQAHRRAGRRRPLAQGAGQCLLLLLHPAYRRRRHGGGRRRQPRRKRQRMAGPGVEYQRAGGGIRRLGLVRVAPGGRPRPDALSDAAHGRPAGRLRFGRVWWTPTAEHAYSRQPTSR